MNTTTEELIRKVKETQKQLIDLLSQEAENPDWQPSPEEWSFRYIAAHLATVDKECYQDRIVRIASGAKPHFASYFNTGRDFSQTDLLEALREWAATRQEIIDFVSKLPAMSFSLTGTHEAFGTLTIPGVLLLMLNHDQEHIQHLLEIHAPTADA